MLHDVRAVYKCQLVVNTDPDIQLGVCLSALNRVIFDSAVTQFYCEVMRDILHETKSRHCAELTELIPYCILNLDIAQIVLWKLVANLL